MKLLSIFLWVIMIFSCNTIFCQDGTITRCNSFDSNLLHLQMDTNDIWEIGKPNKLNFNDSYSGNSSIVTKLDSLYPKSDTSMFVFSYYSWEFGGLPYSLGPYEPLVIEFNHRFITDSPSDFGKIDMSFDNGFKWYDVLSDKYNANWTSSNFHYFESTGDTIFDSLVVSGNSNGWVYSKISKNVDQIIMNDNVHPDSIMVRFTFVSDSIGNNEGWQIDNLCMSMDFIISVNEIGNTRKSTIFPNPNNGTFVIKDMDIRSGIIELFDLKGVQVYSQQITSRNEQQLETDLNSGMYIVKIGNGRTNQISKMYVK